MRNTYDSLLSVHTHKAMTICGTNTCLHKRVRKRKNQLAAKEAWRLLRAWLFVFRDYRGTLVWMFCISFYYTYHSFHLWFPKRTTSPLSRKISEGSSGDKVSLRMITHTQTELKCCEFNVRKCRWHHSRGQWSWSTVVKECQWKRVEITTVFLLF